jgi:hypothetical protein
MPAFVRSGSDAALLTSTKIMAGELVYTTDTNELFFVSTGGSTDASSRAKVNLNINDNTAVADAVWSSQQVKAYVDAKVTAGTADTTIPGYDVTSVVAEAALADAVPFTGITGLPTTLAGYGITNASIIGHTHIKTDITDLTIATATVNGLLSSNDKAKLDSIQEGATTSPTSITAEIVVTDSNNRFVTDAEIASWNAKQTAFTYTPENVANKGIANGYAALDSTGKIPVTCIPAGSSATFVVANPAARLALTGLVVGNKAFEISTTDSYIWDGTTWQVYAIGNTSTVSLTWSNLTGTPTTVAGYGITDASVVGHTHVKANITDFAHTHLDTDLLSLSFSKVINKPTTLAGYGITDCLASSTPGLRVSLQSARPTAPVAGKEMWFDTDLNIVKTFSGGNVTWTQDNTLTTRNNSQAYNVGNVIILNPFNNHLYICIVAGTTAAALPAYPTATAALVTDGDSVFREEGTVAPWVANTQYSVNSIVIPTVSNNNYYISTTGGTSDLFPQKQPIWPTSAGATVDDGGWTYCFPTYSE